MSSFSGLLTRWAYHGFPALAWKSIRRSGLQLATHDRADPTWRYERPTLWFTPDYQSALSYGPMVARFYWPADAVLDHVQDGFEGKPFKEYLTYSTPQGVEVFIPGKWLTVRRSK